MPNIDTNSTAAVSRTTTHYANTVMGQAGSTATAAATSITGVVPDQKKSVVQQQYEDCKKVLMELPDEMQKMPEIHNEYIQAASALIRELTLAGKHKDTDPILKEAQELTGVNSMPIIQNPQVATTKTAAAESTNLQIAIGNLPTSPHNEKTKNHNDIKQLAATYNKRITAFNEFKALGEEVAEISDPLIEIGEKYSIALLKSGDKKSTQQIQIEIHGLTGIDLWTAIINNLHLQLNHAIRLGYLRNHGQAEEIFKKITAIAENITDGTFKKYLLAELYFLAVLNRQANGINLESDLIVLNSCIRNNTTYKIMALALQEKIKSILNKKTPTDLELKRTSNTALLNSTETPKISSEILQSDFFKALDENNILMLQLCLNCLVLQDEVVLAKDLFRNFLSSDQFEQLPDLNKTDMYANYARVLLETGDRTKPPYTATYYLTKAQQLNPQLKKFTTALEEFARINFPASEFNNDMLYDPEPETDQKDSASDPSKLEREFRKKNAALKRLQAKSSEEQTTLDAETIRQEYMAATREYKQTLEARRGFFYFPRRQVLKSLCVNPAKIPTLVAADTASDIKTTITAKSQQISGASDLKQSIQTAVIDQVTLYFYQGVICSYLNPLNSRLAALAFGNCLQLYIRLAESPLKKLLAPELSFNLLQKELEECCASEDPTAEVLTKFNDFKESNPAYRIPVKKYLMLMKSKFPKLILTISDQESTALHTYFTNKIEAALQTGDRSAILILQICLMNLIDYEKITPQAAQQFFTRLLLLPSVKEMPENIQATLYFSYALLLNTLKFPLEAKSALDKSLAFVSADPDTIQAATKLQHEIKQTPASANNNVTAKTPNTNASTSSAKLVAAAPRASQTLVDHTKKTVKKQINTRSKPGLRIPTTIPEDKKNTQPTLARETTVKSNSRPRLPCDLYFLFSAFLQLSEKIKASTDPEIHRQYHEITKEYETALNTSKNIDNAALIYFQNEINAIKNAAEKPIAAVIASSTLFGATANLPVTSKSTDIETLKKYYHIKLKIFLSLKDLNLADDIKQQNRDHLLDAVKVYYLALPENDALRDIIAGKMKQFFSEPELKQAFSLHSDNETPVPTDEKPTVNATIFKGPSP